MNSYKSINEQRKSVEKIYGKDILLPQKVEARAYFGRPDATKLESSLLEVLLTEKVISLAKRFDLSRADTGFVFLAIAEIGGSRPHLLHKVIHLTELIKDNGTFARVISTVKELSNVADFKGYNGDEPIEAFIDAVTVMHWQKHFNEADFDDFLRSITRAINPQIVSKSYESGLELVEQISKELLPKYKIRHGSEVEVRIQELDRVWKEGTAKEYIEMVPVVAKLLYHKSGLELVEQISEGIVLKYANRQGLEVNQELERTWKSGEAREYIEMVRDLAKLLYSQMRN